jgi:hypothetical protein
MRFLLPALVLAAAPALAQVPASTLTFRGAGSPIAPGSYTNLALDGDPAVPLAGITALTVRLVGLSYATWQSGDLRAYLIGGGIGTSDQGLAVPLFQIGAPPGGGGYDRRDFQGTYTFGTSFVRPLVAGPTGVVEPGEYALPTDPQALLARIGNMGGVGAPGRISLQLYDEYAFNGAGSLAEWELTVAFAPVTTAPEPGTWALLGTGLLAVAAVGARRRRAASGEA